ncbi:MAG: hypothetical protein ACR2HS_05025, partial [Gammaproteobacteria bacterium]
SEFSKLNNLEAYLKLPGNFPITKLKFNYKKKPNITDPLVAREIQDMLIAGNKENHDEYKEKNISKITKDTVNKEQKTTDRIEKTITVNKEIEVNIENGSAENSFNF